MAADPATTITVYEGGPLLIRGDFEIRTQDGGTVQRPTMALCRCGPSAIKPLHKVGKPRTSPTDPE
ncbi:CDGSH iron-sulfur domain-containing protein [Actinokineospora sp. NBRC 105648]|uniref:CDGSH iron-sulfur domain-containing protein n=1 Tax=Actinokineospora sp. NBRC 105648 TaxID=3032206 RepID=UPI0024A4BBE1|nr:CDGSH iron-sulfur domain-containing protein [Actinokineospora sp. NBRC 105648]GLZ40552.1 hypothetical protein Acsp05_41760 [Actinokineospora sp. NBRC 105648]